MKGSFLALVSLCFVVMVYTDTCPDGWKQFGLSCYRFSTDKENWNNAQNKCKEMGAYLAEVETKEETEFLQGLSGDKGYWLGGKDDVKEGDWYWAHSGHPFAFTNWNDGEPNNSGGRPYEDCLHLWYDSPAKWNDLGCYRENHYICEKRPTCTCTGSGDPHYKTYDGQWIHFQGACKYTLTSYKDDKCDFSVEAKHEYRGWNKKVTYLRLVDVRYGGHLFRLHKGLKFYVDDAQKYVPYNNNDGVLVNIEGNTLRLELTNCGVSVEYDGNHVLTVTVPKAMGDQLKGICGNCNGVADDLTTKDGKDVSNAQNKYSLIGNSYEIPDDSDLLLPQCTPWVDVHMCTKVLRPKAENSLCSQLNPAKKDQSIFKQCIEADSERALEAYDSCLYDFCATHNDSIVDSIICGDLDSYARQCASLGISIQWRSPSRCPLSCQQNAVYTASMSACQPTCVDPKANEKCTRPGIEGCQCKTGYILSHSDCVPVSHCGCKYNGEYIPIGTEIESSDCTSITKCQLGENGKAELQTQKGPSCGTNAICKPVKGHYQCVCKQGTEGNPFTNCQVPFCTCTASGDPHYRTFDGQMIHFQGACKYTVAAVNNNKCNFAVEGKHQYWGNSKRVTTMRLVDFKYDSKVYRLHQGRQLFVDGVRQFTPFKDNNVKVMLTGNKLRLEGPCNVTVEFDGTHYMELKVPRDIGESVKGMCGNCNGIADDLKTKEGRDVSSESNKYSLIGNSYQVLDDSDLFIQQCSPATDIQSCTSEQRQRAESSLCRHLNPANVKSSVFEKCIEADTMRAQEMYDSCIIDFCELEKDNPDIVCQTLQGYADQCQYIGVPVHWRDTNICPLSCPQHSHFKHLMTSCPATCTDSDAPNNNCKLEPREGCECNQGYILSDTECVPIAECGCKMDNGQYIPVGKKIDKPCDEASECVLKSGESKPTIVTTKVKCEDKCPVGWNYFGNSCYKFSTDQETWNNAQKKCKELGAYLTEVESKDETNFLQGLVGPKQGYWLGGKDDITEGNWYWAHSGLPFNFTHWNGGEPNQAGNEDCVHLWYERPNNWNDYHCDWNQNYICEKRLACPEGMKLFKNSCYKFSTDTKPWNQAKETCKNIGGKLAEVESKEESDYLQKITAQGPARAYWLGGTDIVKEGEWKWVTSGRTFTFANWDDNEPNNLRGKENCLHLVSITEWNDSNCDGGAYYICEL